jgi:hypothetical protein
VRRKNDVLSPPLSAGARRRRVLDVRPDKAESEEAAASVLPAEADEDAAPGHQGLNFVWNRARTHPPHRHRARKNKYRYTLLSRQWQLAAVVEEKGDSRSSPIVVSPVPLIAEIPSGSGIIKQIRSMRAVNSKTTRRSGG